MTKFIRSYLLLDFNLLFKDKERIILYASFTLCTFYKTPYILLTITRSHKMFGIHTPVKKMTGGQRTAGSSSPLDDVQRAGPSKAPATRTQESMVRRLTGEWEAGKVDGPPKSPNSPKKVAPAARPVKAKALSQPTAARRASTEALSVSPRVEPKYINRTSEAKAMLTKAKLHLKNSKNIKTDIKVEVTQALERLYQLVKEAESERKVEERATDRVTESTEQEMENRLDKDIEKEKIGLEKRLIEKITEHSKQIEENRREMQILKEELVKSHEREIKGTYASVAAAFPRRQSPEHAAVHSVVIQSTDETETGDQVMDRVRGVVKAREEGFQIHKIRKARDSKVILGCKTKSEVDKVKEKLRKDGKNLRVEEIKNKDPLIIIKNLNKHNSDEDIITALHTQNKNIFKDLQADDCRAVIRYKKTARNPHQMHVVLSVSPQAWGRLIEASCVHIDMQRLRAEDQSPLVQCSRCLGYGHSKKTCRETEDSCSHCGGPHLRAQCADYIAAEPPTCRNCQKAKLGDTEHNAFSSDCPLRRKWDSIARSAVAYC